MTALDFKTPGLLTAESVVIAAEIISPGPRRTDTKRSEYAGAQIPPTPMALDLDVPLLGDDGYRPTRPPP